MNTNMNTGDTNVQFGAQPFGENYTGDALVKYQALMTLYDEYSLIDYAYLEDVIDDVMEYGGIASPDDAVVAAHMSMAEAGRFTIEHVEDIALALKTDYETARNYMRLRQRETRFVLKDGLPQTDKCLRAIEEEAGNILQFETYESDDIDMINRHAMDISDAVDDAHTKNKVVYKNITRLVALALASRDVDKMTEFLLSIADVADEMTEFPL